MGWAHLFVVLLHLLSPITSEGKVRDQMKRMMQEGIPSVKEENRSKDLERH